MPASGPTRRTLLGLTGLAAAGQLAACTSPQTGDGGASPPAGSAAAPRSTATASGAGAAPAAASPASSGASSASSSPSASPAAGPDITHGPTGAAAVAL